MDNLESQTWLEPLQPREIEILSLISEGLTNRAVAQRLNLSPETVKWYNKQIYSKLGVSSRKEAVKVARQTGLLDVPPIEIGSGDSPIHNNLPAMLTSFVGRQRELSEIIALLKTSRLVSLTGPGGTGKTRIAFQVAAELIQSYRDGVWLVELAAVQDPELVPDTIAKALKVEPAGNTPFVDVLKRFLARRHLLLLLDNCEHLPEAAPLVGELLAAAPHLTVLATSRERLRVYGETEYPVLPLRLPEVLSAETAGQLLDYEAVNLFVQRAHSARPNLKIDDQELQAVVQICQRLDGLPLALELAASQVKIFPPSILVQQLAEDLAALPSGPRDLPARQRTLRAAIEWSENLLETQERVLFAHLAVFSGGADLDAIKQVCNPSLSGNIAAVISALVEKSLVYIRPGLAGAPRFLMLETIHAFAKERLEASDQCEQIYQRHAAFYANLAEAAQREYRTAKQTVWFAKLLAEQNNLRAAIQWSLDEGDLQYALRIVAALRDHWFYYGFALEGSRWSGQVLEKAANAPPGLLAGALCTAGNLAYVIGDTQRGAQLLNQSVQQFEQAGEESGQAWASIFLGITGAGFPEKIDHSIAMVQHSLQIFRKLDDKPGMAQAYNILGELTRSVKDYDAARGYYQQCLSTVQITGERMREAMQYENLGILACHQKQYRQAADLIRRGLSIFHEFGTNYGLASCIALLAGPISEMGFPEQAARLLGAAQAQMDSLGVIHQPADEIEISQYLSAVRKTLGEAAFQKAWQAGQALSFDEAVEYALYLE